MSSMTAPSIVRYPTPPATLNNLPAEQRTRLIRSARKLGKVLGTVPFFLDDAGVHIPATLLPAHAHPSSPYAHSHSHSVPSTPKAPSHLRDPRPYRASRERRQGSIFNLPADAFPRAASPSSSSTTSAASSTTSLASTPRTSLDSLPERPCFGKHRRPATPPRPLVLHLTTVPLSPSDPRLAAPTTPAPHSTLPAVPPTPCTPTPADLAEQRRRKMAKLMRTLGEELPQELVFPPQAPAPEPETDVVQPDELLAFARARAMSPLVTTDVYTTGGSAPGSRAPSPVRAPAKPRPTHRRRSMSLGALQAPVPAPKKRAAAFGVASGARAPRGERWVGEWNRKDMRTVQRELRALKGR